MRFQSYTTLTVFHFLPKLSLTAWPNLAIAAFMFSGLAAANVARKCKLGRGPLCSVWNHDPRATSTPLLIHESKISCSISRRLRVPALGCLVWSIVNQSYKNKY
jgi:hypothetical protein